MSTEQIIMLAIAVFLGVMVIKFLTKPFKFIFKLLMHAASGWVLLFIVNYIGENLVIPSLNIELNFLNSLISGILGIPGVILLLLMNH